MLLYLSGRGREIFKLFITISQITESRVIAIQRGSRDLLHSQSEARIWVATTNHKAESYNLLSLTRFTYVHAVKV